MKYTITWIVALAAIACGLLVCESHYLWKVQELNLFLPTSLFFKQQMVVPGGLLTYVGTWFTQLFYHPWLGVMALCGWWLLLLTLLKRTFAVPARWASLLLIPVALLLLTDVDLGYWLYVLKMRGHFFMATIGTTAVVALLWGFRVLVGKCQTGYRKYLMPLLPIITCAVGYPLLGIYGLAAALLMGIWAWRLMPRRLAAISMLVAILSVIVVPLFCYHHVYHETNLANIYYAGLPVFFITERYILYYIPYFLLALFMVLMVCLQWKMESGKKKEESGKKKEESGKRKVESGKKWMPWAVQAVALAVVAWGVVHFWFKDENFHHEVKMQHLIEQTDWEGVVKEAAAQKDEPTRAIVMMRNLALSRLGRQGNEMYQFRNGAKYYNGPSEMTTLLVVGPLIYYQYGLLNPCNRLCTEMGVEFDWRAEHFKYMIRCALLKGEKEIAMKYINILKRTMFFDDWAARAEEMMDNPELIAKDSEMGPVTHMLHFTDVLSSDQGYLERFVMNQLARSNYSRDPVFQEQALLASLWVKDPSLFWRQFNNYVSQHREGSIPVAYQEAAYLFGMIEGRPNLDKMPFSQSVKDTFELFMQTYSRYEGMDVEEVRKQAEQPYSNNFYYDFYMMSSLPEY